ncbi:MAG: LiaF transmembrane domain-containing protein [Lachnospiraceae bacterium]
MKTHKVGTITFGSILILLGILLILHLFLPALSYTAILNFWPVTLILLGLEILVSNFRSEKTAFVYDGWSIFFLFMTLGFTMCMAILDCVLVNLPEYICL